MTVAAGAFAPGHLGELTLTRLVPFEMVDDVLATTGRTQSRMRLLPARIVVYLLLARCLFAELGYRQVWSKLTSGLHGLPIASPSGSALRQARQRRPATATGLFIRKDLDGSMSGMAVADLDGDGAMNLAAFEGASSGLLGSDDADAGAVLEPGGSAGMLVYESHWAAPFAAALRRGGGQLVAGGRIPVQAVLAALDAVDVNAESR